MKKIKTLYIRLLNNITSLKWMIYTGPTVIVETLAYLDERNEILKNLVIERDNYIKNNIIVPKEERYIAWLEDILYEYATRPIANPPGKIIFTNTLEPLD